jgi:hypothetical protein
MSLNCDRRKWVILYFNVYLPPPSYVCISILENKMNFLKYLIYSFLVCYCSISYGSAGQTGYVKIDTIRVGGGWLRVTGVTDFSDPGDCDGSGNYKNRNILIMEDTPSYKEIVSFVLSAKMSDRLVQFWVSGCKADSGKSYPDGRFVYIQN